MKYIYITYFKIKKDFQSQYNTKGFKKSAVDNMNQEKLINNIKDASRFNKEENDNNNIYNNILESGDNTEDSLLKLYIILTSFAEINYTKASFSIPLS